LPLIVTQRLDLKALTPTEWFYSQVDKK